MINVYGRLYGSGSGSGRIFGLDGSAKCYVVRRTREGRADRATPAPLRRPYVDRLPYARHHAPVECDRRDG